MPPDGFSVADMADDAAGLLASLDISNVHVCWFSGGSATPQELALRHPHLVRSLVRVLPVDLHSRAHDTLERLAQIRVPTLVVAGEVDLCTPPRLGRAVADQIPDAEFVVLAGEAHQPFQEQRDDFNALVDEFWSRVEAVGSSS